jgi:urease accessory protein
MIVPGRVATGESFEYDICYMKALAKNQKEILRFIDIAILEPKKRNLNTLGILGTFSVVGSMYILTMSKYVAELNEAINSSMHKLFKISGGATVLPYNSGVLVRMLGSVAGDLRTAIYEVIKITRKIILNASFSGVRKG